MEQMTLINENKIIYSLFDYSGNWSKPYRDNGYDVRQIDFKHGDDIRWLEIPKEQVYGILSAPPCTHFAGSGAQYWKAKDEDGRTLEGLELMGATARFILATNPVFWVLENPVGRLNRWFVKPVMYFHPYEYGDAYTKKTALWGKFNIPKKNPVEPERVCKQGSWLQKLGGSSEKTKTLRSMTPMGFAKAFYEANQ